MRKKMTPLVALKRYWQLYLFLLIPLAYIITFKYAPMVGIQLAFKNFEYPVRASAQLHQRQALQEDRADDHLHSPLHLHRRAGRHADAAV